jgi:hypothetical protein
MASRVPGGSKHQGLNSRRTLTLADKPWFYERCRIASRILASSGLRGGRWTERGSGEKKGIKETKTTLEECKEEKIWQRRTREIIEKEENMENHIRWRTKKEKTNGEVDED